MELVTNHTTYNDAESVRMFTNGGHIDFRSKATLTMFDLSVYVNKTSMANILAFKDVASKFRITMDTESEHAIVVHKSKEQEYKFQPCGQGL